MELLETATAPDIAKDMAAIDAASIIVPDAPAAAQAAGLRYVSDHIPGITRHRKSAEFFYRDADGKRIRDAATLRRIKALVIPPAWTEVWICPRPNGHIQATGRDARGRKQYRYHTKWRSQRDETKFDRMIVFGQAIERIRQKIREDLSLPGLPREKVLAAVVRLMELTLARVGNPEYARDNRSFGLTTLQNRHVRIHGGQIELDFRAKHGIRHHSVVGDRKLASILKRCRELPGSELFQYVDEFGERRAVDSTDINGYLREISGHDITAKDFRTWAGTNLALLAIIDCGEDKATKQLCAEIVRRVATQLGNTPAVCRKAYIHPGLMEAYILGDLAPTLTALKAKTDQLGAELLEIERLTLRYLQHSAASK